MVGIGSSGDKSVLARCCVVDYDGNVVYDKFVRPNDRVTDFRTHVSGIKPHLIRNGITLRQCQEDVWKLLKGKVLVGHGLRHDLKVLMLDHPTAMVKDTACYPRLMRRGRDGKHRPHSLRYLASTYLHEEIQTGSHDPGEDARAAMNVFKLFRREWDLDERMERMERRKKATKNKGKKKRRREEEEEEKEEA